MPLLEFHRTLLSDVVAQDEFRKALGAAIQGGETVLDIGTGTGIHSMFACQAGARKVYAVDPSPIIELAKAVSIANGFEDRITFIQGAIQDIELPEQVDVITAHLGLTDILDIVPEAAARHLRQGGVVIPAMAELFCAPLESAPAYEQVLFWEQPHYGLTFMPIRRIATQSQYACRISPRELLAEGARLGAFNLSKPSDPLDTEAKFKIARDGILHGIAMWYLEHLLDGITLSSGPLTALHPKLWPNHFFPSAAPVNIRCGDTVAVRFQAGVRLAGGWKWELRVQTIDGEERHHSLHSTMLG
jgi:protein arginine N-methyltransferase 1